MKGTDAEGYVVVVSNDTGVKGVGFINGGWKRNMWEGNIGVMMEAERYPMDCIERVPKESGGHGATQVWVGQWAARAEERWLPSEVLEGRVMVSRKQLNEGWHVREAMMERASSIHFN